MVSPVINMPSSKHSGVSGIPTQLLVVHSAESPLRGGYAQSLTNWANSPGVEASWHWFIDPIARVRMVDEQCTAWHATWANVLSEGFEQAGYARFSRAEWTTAEGLKQMDNLAYTLAERCRANGIPARWLTTAEVNAVRAGNRSIKGICTHAQVDPASRTDPGGSYPYDMLMQKIASHMGGTTPITEDDDMAMTPAERQQFFQELMDFRVHQPGGGTVSIGQHITEERGQFLSLAAAIQGIQLGGSLDVAGLAKALADQLPKQEAEALLDALAKRLGGK